MAYYNAPQTYVPSAPPLAYEAPQVPQPQYGMQQPLQSTMVPQPMAPQPVMQSPSYLTQPAMMQPQMVSPQPTYTHQPGMTSAAQMVIPQAVMQQQPLAIQSMPTAAQIPVQAVPVVSQFPTMQVVQPARTVMPFTQMTARYL
ncbi:cell division protein ZipA-like [Macrobrachium rosenbergii]|uniref:cell division protein ZipA-like n=1 Tax=Macrobrachium rosenbergii TaxID=79674 RepID=UPI0034D4009C